MEFAQRTQGGNDFWKNIFEDDYTGDFIKKQAETFSKYQNQSKEQEVTSQKEYPLIDIFLTDRKLVIIFEIPGVKKDDIHLSYSANIIVIRGTVTPPIDTQYLKHSERYSGPFERKVQLPIVCDGKNISAKFVDGLLIVSLIVLEHPEKRIDID